MPTPMRRRGVAVGAAVAADGAVDEDEPEGVLDRERRGVRRGVEARPVRGAVLLVREGVPLTMEEEPEPEGDGCEGREALEKERARKGGGRMAVSEN